jgi:hypothetical protein
VICSAVVTRVLERSPHTVSDVTVQVVRLHAAPPPPVVPDEEVDQKRLLAKRLPADTAADDLQKFFSRVTDISIMKMTVCKKPSTVLLDLKQQPGWCKIDGSQYFKILASRRLCRII